jgi:Peptidase family M28
MKQNLLLIIFIISSLTNIFVLSGQMAPNMELPDNFAQDALKHVAWLSVKIGIRSAGSDKERDASRYIFDQFRLSGAAAQIEPINFESAEIENTEFLVGGQSYDIKSLGLNPYKGVHEFSGQAILLDRNQSSSHLRSDDIKEKVIISENPDDFFNMMRLNPAVILYVDTISYNKIRSIGNLNFDLKINVKYNRYKSANVAGVIGDTCPDAKEIIISAHYDSFRNSPGADDNASGVGVLIELIKFFKHLNIPEGIRIRFIAFGAEESGLVGSRAYLNKHSVSLDQCELLINLDQVGGNNDCSIEMTGGVRGIPDKKGMNQFPEIISGRSAEDIHGRWRLLEPSIIKCFSISDHPQWLIDIINTEVNKMGIRINPSDNLGSDQMTFTQAGIVSTGIGISGNPFHSPADTIGNINPASLKKAGEFTVGIVHGTIQKLIKKNTSDYFTK